MLGSVISKGRAFSLKDLLSWIFHSPIETLSVAWQLVFEMVQLDPTDGKKKKAKATCLSHELILL